MTETRLALVIIFNHRFERNIPKLEEYYGARFSNRHYLVPFGPTGDEKIIPVIENGYNFSGHIAQGAPRYMQDGITHYVFLGDDAILNPRLHERNLLDELSIGKDEAYIQSLAVADRLCFEWAPAAKAGLIFFRPGFDYLKELPPVDEVKQRFAAMGLTFGKVRPRSFHEAWNVLGSVRQAPLWAARIAMSLGKKLPFPMLAGFSDFFVVPAKAMPRFAHDCGVFAAMNTFAEIAVPTALALACDRINTEYLLGDHFTEASRRRASPSKLSPNVIMGSAIEPFCEHYGYSWQRFMDEYKEDWLYVHPVKLSKWK